MIVICLLIALLRQRQENHKFKASLGYIARHVSKTIKFNKELHRNPGRWGN